MKHDLRDDASARFEQAVLPHMNAAYNLARWLLGSGPDAQDVVQESFLRAFKGFVNFRGDDGRAWLLTIVRNVCFTWLRKHRADSLATEFDEEIHSSREAETPAEIISQDIDHARLQAAIEALPAEFREAIVLREMEGLSYKEIAAVAGVPIGTVMSRLARARRQLREILTKEPSS